MDVPSLIVSPGPTPGTVRTAAGEVLTVPEGWEMLPPGDAMQTRRVKAAGPTWTVQEKRGHKTFGRGLYAPAETIRRVQAEVEAERGTAAYAKKQAAGRERREREQTHYVADFEMAIREFLAFVPAHGDLARRLAKAVAQHATPVGSGTVARTKQLTLPEKAKLAVLAWMRHQTTDYDTRRIKRVRGERCSVRHELAQTSLALLDHYRRDDAPRENCPLEKALRGDAPSVE